MIYLGSFTRIFHVKTQEHNRIFFLPLFDGLIDCMGKLLKKLNFLGLT